LQPVTKGTEEKEFCFQARAWAAALPHQIELRQVFRQQDPVFVATLNRVRLGQPQANDLALLRGTAGNTTSKDGVVATRLCTHVHEAAAINATKLNELPGATRVYSAIDCGPTASLNALVRAPDKVGAHEAGARGKKYSLTNQPRIRMAAAVSENRRASHAQPQFGRAGGPGQWIARDRAGL
jgi:hypothetical protein